MLPGSTNTRKQRDRNSRVDARALEIQRLIGRSLRSVIDLKKIPDVSLYVDCDVLSADGGTRTAAVNGACIALFDAFLYLEEKKQIRSWPMQGLLNAISIGMVDGKFLVDLDYQEDSRAEVDMNVVCTSDGRLIEVQGTAEGSPYSQEQMNEMITLARTACSEIDGLQKATLGL